MATDTLIICSEAGDALCLDIVESWRVWRLFFRSVDDLTSLLEKAMEDHGLSEESACYAVRDATWPLERRQRRLCRTRWILDLCRVRDAQERRVAQERPPAAGKAMDASRGVFLGAVKFVCASVLLAALGLFWIVGAGMAWRAFR